MFMRRLPPPPPRERSTDLHAWPLQGSRRISKIANPAVVFGHDLVLPLDHRSYIERQILVERRFILIFRDVLATLAFGEDGVIVHADGAIHRSSRNRFAAQAANFCSQLFSAFGASICGRLKHPFKAGVLSILRTCPKAFLSLLGGPKQIV